MRRQILVRGAKAVFGKTISELGMYAVCLYDNGQELLNVHAGHLIRTKLDGTNEGGVATGYAVLSSPLLR